MAAPAERFAVFIDTLAKMWSERLGKWAGTFIAYGIDSFMRILGKSFSTKLTPFINKMIQSGKIPPELKPLFDEILNPTGEAGAALGNSLASGLIGGAISRILDPLLLPVARWANQTAPNVRLGIDQVMRLYWLHPKDINLWSERLAEWGLNDVEQALLKELTTVRFPSDVVGQVYLRNKEVYEKYWDDVRALGVTEDRIQLLKESLYKMPTPQDIVTWLAREVFEPKMVEKYGLDDEWAGVNKLLFEQVGLREPMALNYWRAHWAHPAYNEVRRMLHRGQVTEQDVYDWFRVVEIPPYWRKGLTALMWDVPGRVELRMMAQYGLIDKNYAMDILKKDGLAEEYRSVVADMMIVRGIRTDLQTRYSKKWLDAEGVKAEIAKAGISPEIGDRLYQWIVSNTKGDRTANEKDLTVAQITKAVRRGDIPWADGITRLMALGYDEVEADLVMMQSVEVVEEEPTTELNVRVDTIRRQRRQRLITRAQEIASLIQLGIDTGLATAYADNDDLRLAKATTEAE